MLLYHSLAVALPLLTLSSAQGNTWPFDIEGTWSSKSRATLTGPGFYDPISDDLIEPTHTGISYSFTTDGHYEESYYRAIANPTDPACPGGIMQWQHGTWYMNATGSLILTPIAVDGRQLTSQPCLGDDSLYIRYNQSEIFERYSVYIDPYHNVERLDLYQFNGAPMQPLYLVYNPPQMLPTSTLNPITSATASSNKVKRDGLFKRGLEHEVPLNWKANLQNNRQAGKVAQRINADRLWWVGIGMTGIGGLLYLGPRRMGIQLS